MVRFVVSLGILVVLTVSPPASAGAQTSIVTDPAGDARFGAPGFLDVVRVEVTKRGQMFGLQTSVAEPVPAVPPLPPPGTNQLWWAWVLDTDPTTFPAGTPVAPGLAPPNEFVLRVAWDGNAFSAVLFDRRPLLTGGEAVVTPLPFTIYGTDVRVAVGASVLGNPSSFSFGAATVYWSSPPGATEGLHPVDRLEPFFNPWPS